ncbi:MAG TPA: sulfite exporter TauE/SafE family protein [Phnomibacter sp.]|nr:sulfite exporter TauE/SafE family protein [Phnomibacter sp.]
MTTQLILLIILLGLVAGIMSGLVGIGGGIVLVPALIYFLHYNQHQAQGTTLGVLMFPVVLLGFLKYYADSKQSGAPIDFRVVGLLAVGFVVGGYFGSVLALKTDKETLRKVFAVILFYTAIKLMRWDDVIIQWFKKIF